MKSRTSTSARVKAGNSRGRISRRLVLGGLTLTLAVCLALILAPDRRTRRSQSPRPETPPTQPAETPTTSPVQSLVQFPRLADDLKPVFGLIRQQHTGPARVRLRDYLVLHPENGQATFLFGLTYHREKKYGQAREHYEQALRFDPSFALTRYFLAWALFYLGDLENSRAQFETFLAHHPDEPDSIFGLGLIELDEDNLAAAQRNFERSLELLSDPDVQADPEDVSKAHTRLGEVYDRRGDLETARSHYQTAVDLFPDHYEAFYKLYRVLVRLGEHDLAAKVHEQYLASRERVRPGTSFPE